MRVETRCVGMVLALWLIAGVGGCSRLGRSSGASAKLPAADFQIQGWLETITPSTPVPVQMPKPQLEAAKRERITAMTQLLRAREQRKLSDKTWLLQVLRHVSSMEGGTYAWGAMLHWTHFSIRELDIDSLSAIQILLPYQDSTDVRVARQAGEMIDATFDSDWQGPADITRSRKLIVLERYLRSCAPSDPEASMVSRIYSADPEHAPQVIASVYLDAESQQQFERNCKELKRLILGYELEMGEANEFGKQIEAKLVELAGDPHWSVRLHALTVVARGRSGASSRWPDWARDSTVPILLQDDPHALVKMRAGRAVGYNIPDPRMRALFGGEVRK